MSVDDHASVSPENYEKMSIKETLEDPGSNEDRGLTIEGTQVIRILFAVYGLVITPIGWARAGIVWGYSLIGLFAMSGIKILTIKALVKFGIAETAT